jgi:iron complex transport system permease protein
MTIAEPLKSRAQLAPRRRSAIILLAAALVVLASVLSMGLGPTGLSLDSLPGAARAVLGHSSDADDLRAGLVLLNVRLPRTLIGLFVGGALAAAGVLMQSLFRNPLADPGLIGVSSGAALAAVATIAFGQTIAVTWLKVLGIYLLPTAAFVGGLSTTLVLVWLASRRGELVIGVLLLSGIAVGAFAGSLTGLMAYASDDRELRDLTLWSLGSLSGASWTKVMAIAPFAAALLVVLPPLTRALNGLLLGEAEAFHLGIDIERAKRVIIAATAGAVGAAVAVAGIVGFVGLVVPHLVRQIAGSDHRKVMPASVLLGGALVVGADVIARMVVRPAELPLGIIMALVGAPVFLNIIVRRGIGGVE